MVRECDRCVVVQPVKRSQLQFTQYIVARPTGICVEAGGKCSHTVVTSVVSQDRIPKGSTSREEGFNHRSNLPEAPRRREPGLGTSLVTSVTTGKNNLGARSIRHIPDALETRRPHRTRVPAPPPDPRNPDGSGIEVRFFMFGPHYTVSGWLNSNARSDVDVALQASVNPSHRHSNLFFRPAIALSTTTKS